MKLYPYLTPYTKTNSKRISIGAQSKTLRRKYSKSSNLGYGNGFLAKTSKKKKKPSYNSTTTKEKHSNNLNGKVLVQTFLQRRYTNGQEGHEKCSISITIKKMQIKTIMKYLFTSTRMAIIIIIIIKTTKRTAMEHNKCW